jgi:hypothetical protein
MTCHWAVQPTSLQQKYTVPAGGQVHINSILGLGHGNLSAYLGCSFHLQPIMPAFNCWGCLFVYLIVRKSLFCLFKFACLNLSACLLVCCRGCLVACCCYHGLWLQLPLVMVVTVVLTVYPWIVAIL